MEEESNGVSKNKNDKTKLTSNIGQDKTQPTNFLEKFSQPEKQVTHHNKQTQNSISSSSSTSSNPVQEPDLNLRLSVSGGSSSSSETSKENPLARSLSTGGIINVKTNNSDEDPFVGRTCIGNLPKACSLPAGAEQVQRVTTMRKIHSMRRIHAKNMFIAKRQRSRKEAKEKEKDKQQQQPDPPKPTVPSEVAAWAAASAANSPALCRALLKIKSEGLIPAKRGRSPGQSKPTAPGSFKIPPVPKNAELVITAGVSVNQAEPESENPPSRACCGSFESNGMDVMRQMPSVRATGDGPNGRRVEGFLCSYMRGQVSIVCICHGSFLSPAEFVKHAGGRDVPNPMKHITVYSTFAA